MTPLAMTVYTLAVWLEASPVPPESMHLVFSKFCACGGLEFSALLPQNRTESGHKTLSRMQMGLLFPSQGPCYGRQTLSVSNPITGLVYARTRKHAIC